jgi:hypothetical protein
MKTGTPPSGWTFFGLFEMNEESDAKPDKFSYSDLTAPLIKGHVI